MESAATVKAAAEREGQRANGSGRQVCSQPCVTAYSFAASRVAKVVSKRKTRL